MQKFATLLICLFVLTTTIAHSQSPSPTKITVYKVESNAPTTVADSSTESGLQHLIKWNYSLLPRGVFLLNYEFPIFKKLNGEVGAGVTYRDFIFEATHGYVENTTATKTASFAAEAGLRLYPGGVDDFEGFYVSPMVSYRKYKTLSEIDVKMNTNTYTMGYNFLDLQFKVGYQYESFWIDDLVTDIYAGVAWRNATVNLYENKSLPNTIPSYEKRNEKLTFPQFMFGLKMGFPF